jgi:hypothetical protein
MHNLGQFTHKQIKVRRIFSGYVISHQMKFKKTTYMQFYIGIAIADIGPYNLWLLPVTVK